ncbi:MAG: ComF family protein [Desulfosoma sp.]|uniref:ComF family protein n=1 Tax=Desulfosoma sp. TaxID=2603217 RepID=UPI00404B430A
MGGGVSRLWHQLKGFKRALAWLADQVFPPQCAACGSMGGLGSGSPWCPECLDAVPWILSPLCPSCGRPYDRTEAMPDHLCGECLQGHYRFDAARSAALYEGAVRRGILQLKFGGRLHWAPALGRLIAHHAPTRALLDQCDLLVPVPMHLRRVRRRGFNQAALVARFAARSCSRPVHLSLLRRTRFTRPQTRLSRAERLRNVRGAFEVVDERAVRGRKVTVVDDVFTTGTTLSECADALKGAGAAWVGAVTVARVVLGARPTTA